MKLSLSSLAIVGIAASALPGAAGHLRSNPRASSLSAEDKAHSSHDKGATPLSKGTEEMNHESVGRKLPRKKKNKKKSKKKPTGAQSIDAEKEALKIALAEAKDEATRVKKAADDQESGKKSQADAEQSRKESEQLSKQLEEVKSKQDEAALTKKAADEEAKVALATAQQALEAKLQQSQTETKLAEATCRKEAEESQATVEKSRKEFLSKVSEEITQVESEQSEAALSERPDNPLVTSNGIFTVEKETEEAFNQAWLRMEEAMKEKWALCEPEAPVAVRYIPQNQDIKLEEASTKEILKAQLEIEESLAQLEESLAQAAPAPPAAVGLQLRPCNQRVAAPFISEENEAFAKLLKYDTPVSSEEQQLFEEPCALDGIYLGDGRGQVAYLGDGRDQDYVKNVEDRYAESAVLKGTESTNQAYVANPQAKAAFSLDDLLSSLLPENSSSITITNEAIENSSIITKCAAATDALLKAQNELLIRMQAQNVPVVPDLSKLAATVGCGDSEKQQSEEGASILVSKVLAAGQYPFKADEELSESRTEFDTDTDGN